MISLGIDLSLTGTGVVVLENGKVVEEKLIKSKPCGDTPLDELHRIRAIVSQIRDIVVKYNPVIERSLIESRPRPAFVIVNIENLAFAIRKTSSLTQLSGLNYLVRAMLDDLKIHFILTAPTTLKKYICKGNVKKDVVMLEVYKKYGLTFSDNNLCDAFVLSAIASALVEKPIEKEHTKQQREVLKLLSKQIDNILIYQE